MTELRESYGLAIDKERHVRIEDRGETVGLVIVEANYVDPPSHEVEMSAEAARHIASKLQDLAARVVGRRLDLVRSSAGCVRMTARQARILAAIRAELKRQWEVDQSNGLGYFDDDDPADAVIDGRVDLVALAGAAAEASFVR